MTTGGSGRKAEGAGRGTDRLAHHERVGDADRSTGELGDKIKEQSLILDTGKGLYVLTGCAHPGLSAIMDSALSFGKVKGIIGGLHDSKEFERLEGLELVAAGHCTTHKEEIKKLFQAEYVEIGAGLSLELE